MQDILNIFLVVGTLLPLCIIMWCALGAMIVLIYKEMKDCLK